MTLPKINNTITNQSSRLSVQISLNGLSFLASSPAKEVLYFSEKKFNSNYTPEELGMALAENIDQTPELNVAFSQVTLIYTTSNYAIVPSTLFDEKKASEYLKFNTKILSNDYISQDSISSCDAVVVYVPLININNYIFDRYGSFEYYHATSLLIEHILQKEKYAKDSKMYVHVIAEQFECIIVKHGQLQLCNTYNYTTPEDFAYYTLFCLEQLQLNPDTTEVVLCGAIDTDSELYSILYRYIRNISFLAHTATAIASEQKHQNFLLKTTL